MYSDLYLKLILNQLMNTTSYVNSKIGSPGATAASEKMTKVHQDEEYVYPSLDLSDDEMEIAPTSLQV